MSEHEEKSLPKPQPQRPIVANPSTPGIQNPTPPGGKSRPDDNTEKRG